MLIDIYVEALLADPDLADQVGELWDAGEISNRQATIVWRMVAGIGKCPDSVCWRCCVAIAARR